MPGKARNGERGPDDMDRTANGRDDMSNDHLLLELAKRALDDLAEHKRECVEERREAKRERHDFRAEVALGLSSLREEMRAGFAKVDGSVSKIHERVNLVTTQSHDAELKTWDWRLKTAVTLLGGIVAILLGVAGWALVQWLTAAGVLK